MKGRLCGVILCCFCMYFGGSSQAAESRGVVEVSGETFECIRDMTPVRGFYVDNL